MHLLYLLDFFNLIVLTLFTMSLSITTWCHLSITKWCHCLLQTNAIVYYTYRDWQGFSGKISLWSRWHSERDHRSRSLCQRPKELISEGASLSICFSIWLKNQKKVLLLQILKCKTDEISANFTNIQPKIKGL